MSYLRRADIEHLCKAMDEEASKPQAVCSCETITIGRLHTHLFYVQCKVCKGWMSFEMIAKIKPGWWNW